MHTGHIPGLVFLVSWTRLWRTTVKEKVEERRKGMEQIVDVICTGYQIDFKLRLFFDHFVLCRKSDQNYKKTSRLVKRFSSERFTKLRLRFISTLNFLMT